MNRVLLLLLILGVTRVREHVAAAVVPELISATPASSGPTGFGPSGGGEISGDGRFILFHSAAPDLTFPATPRGVVNLFLTDRQRGTFLISENTTGTGGVDASCRQGVFNEDARYVVFQSAATNLAPGDTDTVADIFLRDVTAGTTLRISKPYADLRTNLRWPSSNPSISADGARIVFASAALDLVPVPAGQVPLFYLFERSSGTNRAITISPSGFLFPTNQIGNPVISKTGRMVFFEARAVNLITGFTTQGTHVYGYDLANDTLQMASTNAMTAVGLSPTTAADCLMRGASADGRFVVFATPSVRLPSGGFASYLYRHDLPAAFTEVIATNSPPPGQLPNSFSELAVSADGEYVTYGVGPNLYRWNARNNLHELVTATTEGNPLVRSNATLAFMTPDARYIGFASAATNVVEGEAPGFIQLYRRDMVTQKTVRITAEPGGPSLTTADFYDGSISDDGLHVVFTSNDANLIPGDANAGPDCLLWYAEGTPRFSAVSKPNPALKISRPYRALTLSSRPISANGRHVVFSGQNTDGTGAAQVWLRDRAEAVTTLVSHHAGEPPESGSGVSQNAMISQDGRWIAYESTSTNLIEGVTDTNANYDVFLFDRETGANRLITKAATGDTTPPLISELKGISPDGRYVLIGSPNTKFGEPPVTPAPGPGGYLIYLWDREAGAFRLLTANLQGSGVLGQHSNTVFSPDSRRLALIGIGQVAYYNPVTGEPASGAGFTTATLLLHEIRTGRTVGYPAVASAGRNVAFSPDGSKLITSALASTVGRGIWRIDLATGMQDAFMFEGARVAQLSSALAGDKIAYLAQSGATLPYSSAVGLLDFARGETNLLSLPGDNFPNLPSIGPDGNFVLFQSSIGAVDLGDVNGLPDVYAYAGAGNALTPLTGGDGPGSAPILSAYGSTALALSSASGFSAEDLNNSMDLFAFQIAPPRAGPPVIVSGPANQAREAGAAASFFIVADGGWAPMTYQWYRNGVALVDDRRISGATNPSLMIINLEAGDAGAYHVVVQNSHGSTPSASAQLKAGGEDYPELEVLRQADSVQLRWPREPAGFILESAATVDAPPEAWQTVPGEPVVDGGFKTLNVSPLVEARFFRLRK